MFFSSMLLVSIYHRSFSKHTSQRQSFTLAARVSLPSGVTASKEQGRVLVLQDAGEAHGDFQEVIRARKK